MPQPWQTGKVIRIEQEAAQTRRFWIQLPALTSFDFAPGQFVTLDLPIHESSTSGSVVIPLPPGRMAQMSSSW